MRTVFTGEPVSSREMDFQPWDEKIGLSPRSTATVEPLLHLHNEQEKFVCHLSPGVFHRKKWGRWVKMSESSTVKTLK